MGAAREKVSYWHRSPCTGISRALLVFAFVIKATSSLTLYNFDPTALSTLPHPLSDTHTVEHYKPCPRTLNFRPRSRLLRVKLTNASSNNINNNTQSQQTGATNQSGTTCRTTEATGAGHRTGAEDEVEEGYSSMCQGIGPWCSMPLPRRHLLLQNLKSQITRLQLPQARHPMPSFPPVDRE